MKSLTKTSCNTASRQAQIRPKVKTLLVQQQANLCVCGLITDEMQLADRWL